MTRTRFAPSPTGYLHIGALRTAAYAYALAKHDQGQFILRIEDTDQKREIPGGTQKIYDTLGKFLTWDETLLQSDRAKQGVYREAALKLVESGHAFYCDCQPRNAKTEGYSLILRDPCREKKLTSGAIKLKVPDGEKIKFYDFVLKKEVEFDSDQVTDTILLKSDGTFPTYHLAVVVDDHFQHISHVMRGPEWITSTPIHILVHRYLRYDLPQIGHLTVILDPQGGKLSKRKDNVAIEDFLAKGYLPEALLNFVILLGWAPKDNRELFTLNEFVQEFDINGFQKSNPKLDLKKLDWFNGHYLRQKSDAQLLELIKPRLDYEASDAKLLQILPLVKDRTTTLVDMIALMKFFFVAPAPQDVDRQHIQAAKEALEKVAWNKTDIESQLLEKVRQQGWKNGDFFMSLRLAICGSRITPPLTESLLILGKAEVLSRLSHYAQQTST